MIYSKNNPQVLYISDITAPVNGAQMKVSHLSQFAFTNSVHLVQYVFVSKPPHCSLKSEIYS